MKQKIELTIAEKINRARDGRSQSWIIGQMNQKGVAMNDVQFSRKKNGHIKFTEQELKVLSEILSISL